jgi:hypothetical protein
MYKSVTRTILNDALGSWAGTIFFAFWIGQRFYFSQGRSFLWWLITFQFLLFVLAYLTRQKAQEHARGFREMVFPFICAAMPFALENYPFKPIGRPLADAELLYSGLMISGTILIIWGVLYLRRSFSIMAEVRSLTTSGIYRITRHPMYLGSLLSSAGILLALFNILNLFIFIVFCACQIYRAFLEEEKIRAILPEYRTYAARVGWFWILGRRRLG